MNNLTEEVKYIPTLEEIKNVLKQLLQEQKYKVIRKISDDKGIYIMDVKVSKKNGYDEYSYIRKGRYQEGQSSITGIYLTFFNQSGVPKGGHSVAKFIDGKWILTP